MDFIIGQPVIMECSICFFLWLMLSLETLVGIGMADVAVGNRPIWPMGRGWKNHMLDRKKIQKSADNTKRGPK